MRRSINIILASDQEHEALVAELHIDNRFVAVIHQDEGPENLVVELPGPGLVESMVLRQVPLADLVKGLKLAAEKLNGREWVEHRNG